MRGSAGNGIFLSCTKESLRNAEKIGKGVDLVNKKIILTISGCMMMTAVVSAANPFTDVPQDSWAYQSVTELANSGIVEGVDGKHFQGDRNITRYEAAQMVARALAREDRVRGEEREKIQKLAEEFSEELNGLGVRVDDLENRIENIKLSGDIRVRYLHEKDAGKYADKSWQFRGRLRAEGKINEKCRLSWELTSGIILIQPNQPRRAAILFMSTELILCTVPTQIKNPSLQQGVLIMPSVTIGPFNTMKPSTA